MTKIMHRYISQIASIGFYALALSITVSSHSVDAQNSINFVDLNQSRQFFDEGREIVEQEIVKLLQQNLESPEIKLPQNISRYQTIDRSNSLYARMKLEPIFQTEIDLVIPKTN